uniref:Reverse transcriptase domain-containing protein n=1 Tax=Tanacetum cinerariifolium TaxID=118510 RepID=A0A6L2MQ51_TANCI|nr:reverse transcriptase domain-containing protein [Tanacetum cinerariifolium]
MTSGREITPPGFSIVPTTTTMFAATTPENTPLGYRVSTSTDPNTVISLAFVEANYETLESILRDRRRQMRNKDLRTELEYFSEDYDKEREMEPRPKPARAVTPPLRAASPKVHRRRERVVRFEEIQNRGESRVEKNSKGGRPSEKAPRGNGSQNVNLPPLLAAHIGRSENGQPLQSSLTFAYGGQALSNNIGGNLPHNGTFLSHNAQPFIPRSLNVPRGFMPMHVYPHQQPPMYAFPNMPAYANLNPTGLFLKPLGLVTPFVWWIEDYPLPDGLKMPSHIGSYYGKGDPDNFLHLFEGAIRMQKWLMPVACHMFTYTLKDSARIWWNSQKACSILDYEDLKAKYPSHLQGLNGKMYTWVEAKDVATNSISNDRRDSFKRPKKSSWNNNKGQMGRSQSFPYKGESHKLLSDLAKRPREIFATERVVKNFEQLKHHIEEAIKTGQLAHLVKGLTKKRENTSDTQSGEKKKEEKPALEKTPILIVSGPQAEEDQRAITGQGKLQHNSQRSMEEEGNSTNNGQGNVKNILSCIDTEEKIVIDAEYLEQKTTTHITGVPRTLIIREETFSIEHQLNLFNHTELVRQKKRSLAPERNKVACTQVEELVEAGVMQEVKYQTWISNPIIVKKDDGKWKLRIDFTNINKACTREPHPLPTAQLRAKNLHKN